jgi:hypothetical protein
LTAIVTIASTIVSKVAGQLSALATRQVSAAPRRFATIRARVAAIAA